MSELSWLQPLSQRPHPPRAAEKHVSPCAQRAQLLHASLLRPPVLEPNLQEAGGDSKAGIRHRHRKSVSVISNEICWTPDINLGQDNNFYLWINQKY